MASFVCNDTLMGRSIQGYNPGYFGTDQLVSESGLPGFFPKLWQSSARATWYGRRYVLKWNRALSGITGRNYADPTFRQAIADIDVNYNAFAKNHRGLRPYMSDDEFAAYTAKTLQAWADTGVVYEKFMDDLLAGYLGSVNYQDAVSLDAAAAHINAELNKYTAINFVYPVTRAQPGYTNSVNKWKAKIKELRDLAAAARAKEAYTQADVETQKAVETGETITQQREREAMAIALARGDFAPPPADPAEKKFNIMPLAIGAAAIGGGLLLLKG